MSPLGHIHRTLLSVVVKCKVTRLFVYALGIEDASVAIKKSV